MAKVAYVINSICVVANVQSNSGRRSRNVVFRDVALCCEFGEACAAERFVKVCSSPSRGECLPSRGRPFAAFADKLGVCGAAFNHCPGEQEEVRLPSGLPVAHHCESAHSINVALFTKLPESTHDNGSDLLNSAHKDGALGCSDLAI